MSAAATPRGERSRASRRASDRSARGQKARRVGVTGGCSSASAFACRDHSRPDLHTTIAALLPFAEKSLL
eukprot:6192545-Pleurochrysis_carterae.AAC.5